MIIKRGEIDTYLGSLYTRPWRGGEAKNMGMVQGTLNTVPHDLVNIVASFMPPIAKTWPRSVPGRIIMIVRVILQPIAREDDEIQEMR